MLFLLRKAWRARPAGLDRALGLWLALAALLAGLILGTGCRPVVSGEILRLHVIAASDGEEDQAAKLAVRDALQQTFAAAWSGAEDGAACRALAREDLAAVEACADRVLAARGLPYRARAELGVFSFPERTYGDQVCLPAGDYYGLRVLLGEARGHNWWCVLYPPLCLMDTGDTPAVRSWIWEQLPERWQRSLRRFWVGEVCA